MRSNYNGVQYISRVLILGLSSCTKVVVQEVCIWSKVFLLYNIEGQVTTDCLQHGCNSDNELAEIGPLLRVYIPALQQ